jgi:MATE family multidrug resistance protein
MALAAHRIAFNALSLSFLPGVGFAVAATALVGQSVGARDMPTAAAITRIATLWGMAWMGTLGLVLFFFSVPLMELFSDDPEVISIGSAGIRTVALAQPFWAILFVQAGALRGTGNTRYPLIVNATTVWTAVLLTAIALPRIGGGLVTVWASFLIVAPITCVLLWWRFRHTVSTGIAPAMPEPV